MRKKMRSYPYRVIERCSRGISLALVIVMASYIHCQLTDNPIMVDENGANDINDNNLSTDTFSLTEATLKPSMVQFVPGKNKLSTTTTTTTVTTSITTSTSSSTIINASTKPVTIDSTTSPTVKPTPKPIFTRHQFMIMMMPSLPNVSGHTGKRARGKHLVHKKVKSAEKSKLKPTKKSTKNGKKSKQKFRQIKPTRLNKMGKMTNNTLLNSNKTANDCNQTDMDNCSQKLLMITDKKFHYPANMTEMNNRCKEMKSMENCIVNYTRKCIPLNQRHSLSLLIYGITRTNKGLCRNSRRRRAFAAFGSSCGNRLQQKINEFVEDMNRALFGIIGYPNKKMRIPLSCCNYYKFKNRVLDMYKLECPEHKSEMERLLEGFSRNSLSFMCGSYTEHSQKCLKIINHTPIYNKTLSSDVYISTYVDMIDNNFI